VGYGLCDVPFRCKVGYGLSDVPYRWRVGSGLCDVHIGAWGGGGFVLTTEVGNGGGV
jgi:hypothetical protein